MKNHFFLFLFLLFANGLFAQQGGQRGGGQPGQQRGQRAGQTEQQPVVQISGFVKDHSDNTPLVGAHVSLVHFRDSTRVFHSTTDRDGGFSFQVSRGRYFIGASFVGYQTLVVTEPVAAVQPENRIDDLMLIPGATLDEVQIRGERPNMLIRGDTLDYDARAYRVNPDASAEDLIRRMAGISVQDGTVSAQGEEVQRVFVDGREFFGNDPSIALRNLPAEVIERIEIFDRMSDQAELTGFDDGERSKTINIVTRLDTRSGQFGRVYSGYGGDDRYQGGIVTNIFHNDSRISILGMSNNINETNFTRDDITSFFGGGRGGQGGRGGGGPGGGMPMGDFRGGSRNGFNTTHAVGLNYSNS
ncbi:MAG: TonB-dependent receptor, partial [Bacteroidales bacterium]